MRYFFYYLMVTLIFLLLFHADSQCQTKVDSDSTAYKIVLKDGTTLHGEIIQRENEIVTIRTIGGIEMTIPKNSIVSIKALQGRIVEDVYFRNDPNYSRLLFAPTGRPLKKGEGYFSDYWVLFPGIAYGFSDNFSLLAGMSLLPGADLDQQMFYFAPRVGVQKSEKFAISAGAIYMSVVDEFAAGIAFAAATMGEIDRSFTAGIGLGYTKDEGDDFRFAEHPIIMLGTNIRLSNNAAFISENWLITGSGFKLSQQPFSLAVRLFGEQIAVDLGAILIGEVLQEGFPIPWLSFAYNFGRK